MASAQDAIEARSRKPCVILTRSNWHSNCLAYASRKTRSSVEPVTADMGQSMAIKTRESSPLWVWLAIALLAVGGGAYAMAAFVFEYFTAAGG
jgi:hypothetical protein